MKFLYRIAVLIILERGLLRAISGVLGKLQNGRLLLAGQTQDPLQRLYLAVALEYLGIPGGAGDCGQGWRSLS